VSAYSLKKRVPRIADWNPSTSITLLRSEFYSRTVLDGFFVENAGLGEVSHRVLPMITILTRRECKVITFNDSDDCKKGKDVSVPQ
jgi:hypothetical protein